MLALMFMELLYDGCWTIGIFFYLAFVTLIASVRIECRERFEINGNPLEDFFASLFLYPNVIVQLDLTTKVLKINSVKPLATKNLSEVLP